MNESLKIAAGSIAGVALGLAVGYKVAEKRLSVQFEERLERETAEMKTFYKAVKQPYSTPEEAVKELIPEPAPVSQDPREKAQKVQYNKVVLTEKYAVDDTEEGELAAAEQIVSNVFDKPRDTTKPYIITQDEYMANDPGHEQMTLTWYNKGKVLVDVRDTPIDSVDQVVGVQFKTNFGTDSSDPNIVHVRNESINIDFEILYSERSFEEDVLGQVST